MFMMRIPDNDRSKAERGISSILELTGIVFSPDKNRWLLLPMQTHSYLQSTIILPEKHR